MYLLLLICMPIKFTFDLAKCNEGLGVEFLNRNFTLKGPSAILAPRRYCEFDINYLSF